MKMTLDQLDAERTRISTEIEKALEAAGFSVNADSVSTITVTSARVAGWKRQVRTATNSSLSGINVHVARYFNAVSWATQAGLRRFYGTPEVASKVVNCVQTMLCRDERLDSYRNQIGIPK
jgi:hypothetical protein